MSGITTPLTIDGEVQQLTAGLVEADDIEIRPSDEQLLKWSAAQVEQVRAGGCEGGETRRHAVRALLRLGGFKPSGRNKPAHEYLLRTATGEGQWPSIFNAVDVLNVISLRSGLPISLVATLRLGQPMSIRYGRPGESFVFNQSGQSLDVNGLIVMCQTADGQSQPVGSPVKDSQLAKVTSEDSRVLACIYAPQNAVMQDNLAFWTEELGQGLKQWCHCRSVATSLLSV